MNPPRPIPKLDDDNRAFWTGGADGRLMMMTCADCGKVTHPPRQICRYCQSEAIAPQAVAGTGTVDTFTVNHQPWAPGLEVPFVIARVKLDGVTPDVFLTTNIVNCPADAVRFDEPVRVTFHEENGIHYPLFEKQAPNDTAGAR